MAPTRERAAETPIAGANPLLNVWAEPKLPTPANTAARIATPNAAPSWRNMLNAPDALPISLAATELTTAFWPTGIAEGTKAGDDQRRDEFGVCEAWPGDQPNPGKRSGLEEHPADHERPLTEPVNEDTGERGAHEQHGGSGEQSQPGTKRSVAQRGLEELCQEERGAVQRYEEQKACRIAR